MCIGLSNNSLKSTPSSLNFVTYLKDHPIMKNSSAVMQKAIQSHLQKLDVQFTQAEKNLSQDEKMSSLLLNAKKTVAIKFMETTDLKSFILFASHIAPIIRQIDPKTDSFKPISWSLEKSNNESTNFFEIETDEKRLGSNVTNRVLSWLQQTRIKLFKGEGKVKLQTHQLVALMKRIGDLEDRLLKRGQKPSESLSLLYLNSAPINLDEVLIEEIDTADKGDNPSYYVFDVPSSTKNNSKKQKVETLNQEGKKIGIFKPYTTGEMYTSNPQRQIAAYNIDHANGGVTGVALTLYAHFEGKKESLGSLQVFKENYGAFYHLEQEERSTLQSQLLMIHRARLYDLDAHQDNILWNLNPAGEAELVSIDHDACLPQFQNHKSFKEMEFTLEIDSDQQPLASGAKEYLKNIDLKKEVEILKKINLPVESINLFKSTTWFLQKAATEGLTIEAVTDYFTADKEFVFFMIDTQDSLNASFNKTSKEYDTAFEHKMKSFIGEKVMELKGEL